MPIVRKEGKDTIIFASKEDHATPSKIDLPEPEPSPGLLLPNGEINWNCPCLGGMATGPCGLEFREAFSCYHYSTSEPKGSECYEAFKTMQECMSAYPALYGSKEADIDDFDDDDDSRSIARDNEDHSKKNNERITNDTKEVSKRDMKDLQQGKSVASSSRQEFSISFGFKNWCSFMQADYRDLVYTSHLVCILKMYAYRHCSLLMANTGKTTTWVLES
ncbi:mitochondrial intermembrane space import and assembly protein 40-B [Orussus abietinus]|uniref:mitochondrial intermembrane space import and assembly protein 40-B n=1 Tax=Orussus abietinus TaxID=222816 RepID=UPI0006265F68|nr:mitochondrial intermembrane space import and assembly protein 40-B [Orussus abietinus]XP_023290730.1 mitochondrial intermembrane space import and assembly protein 40-B [Orussus abietinus]XP_023290731.1 mitochondrial intermembrane space import and assembly protein 40-B [Orussus abietinus]XP_023290732.1 mitochondrial intermembrane space import and assembly protein 40-B [Orussus abietinus]XP_023290733.1 mitochondrial intermembrane space import and assembly protein 40-B [Orussus abietinus]XP_02